MSSGENNPPLYARIAVNVPHVQGVFDYHLPEFLQDQVSIGHLVTVPFGAQTVQGIIMGFPHIPEVIKTKASTSTAQNQTVGGAAISERGLPAGDYYLVFTGDDASYRLVYEERP